MRFFINKIGNYIIERYKPEMSDKIKKRLCTLGFCLGEEITIIRYSSLKRTCLIAVMGSLVTLQTGLLNYMELKKI